MIAQQYHSMSHISQPMLTAHSQPFSDKNQILSPTFLGSLSTFKTITRTFPLTFLFPINQTPRNTSIPSFHSANQDTPDFLKTCLPPNFLFQTKSSYKHS